MAFQLPKLESIMNLLEQIYEIKVTFYTRTYDFIGSALAKDMIYLLHRIVHVAMGTKEPFTLSYDAHGDLLIIPYYKEEQLLGEMIIGPFYMDIGQVKNNGTYLSTGQIQRISSLVLDYFYSEQRKDKPVSTIPGHIVQYDEDDKTIDLDYLEECQLRDYILTRQYDKVLAFIEGPLSIPTQELGGDYLRASKNYFVISTTLVSRWCIEAGISQKIAFGIGGQYIHEVERSKNPAEIQELFYDMVKLFLDELMHNKGKGLCKEVSEAIHIIQNRNQLVSIQELASQIGWTASYLSSRFSMEMGISLNNYIKKRVIDYSKKILRCKGSSIQDVSELVGFKNQSHFTKVFKNIEGITPREYKRTMGSL